MQSIEVSEDEWISYFDQFSRDHVGWPVTIEVLESEAGPQRLMVDQPLQGISFDVAGSRPCTIEVGAGDTASANFTHVIDKPLHIRLAGDEALGRGTIEIEPAEGAPTLVHFHRPA